MSPEMFFLYEQSYPTHKIDFLKSDIYSFGLIILSMMGVNSTERINFRRYPSYREKLLR